MIANLPKISYDLPHESGSISLAGNETAEQDGLASSDSLEDSLQILNDRLRRHGRYLMIGLDELQDAPPDDLLRIIRVVHETAGTDRPVLFMGAGPPNSSRVLQGVRTYTERWANHRRELLTRSETFEAVDVPAREFGVHWHQDAVEAIYGRSHGYPYFVQEFAFRRGFTIRERT